MNDKIASFFLPDIEKTDLSNEGFFDRVINLRLTTRDDSGVEKDVYVVRSDFEIVYPKMMKVISENKLEAFQALQDCYIRKCQHKPSIKVQYKRVSLNTAVEVDIFVSNFYMLDKNGQIVSGFNNNDYKLSKVEFSMGYFSQFYKAFSSQPPKTLEQFKNVGFNEDATEFGIPVMTMSNVVYTQMDKLPPDMTLHIHGFVGNTLAPKFNLDTDNFPDEYEKLMSSNAVIHSDNFKKADTYLEYVFYNTITKNWIKKGTPSKLESTTIQAGKEFTTDTMSDSDAEKYGIKVYLSEGAKKYSKEMEKKFSKDNSGNVVYPTVTIQKASTAEAKMNAVESAYSLKDFTHTFIDTSGDYIVYLKSELNDIEKLLGSGTLSKLYEKTAVAKHFNNQIPAVYNITADALCTIVCPFFCFINPFEKLYFKSRYALGGLVSYYTNFNVTLNEFYALWETVSFATVEDVNECTIVCTGSKKKGV